MENNPLLNYDENQRTAYLVLLASVATADHENSEGEVAFMQQICSVAQISEASIQQVSDAMTNPSGVNYTAHIGALKDSDLKYALVTDVINMIHADGDMDADELGHVKRLNAALGINDQQFELMTQYVKEANTQAAAQEGTPGVLGFLGGGNSSEGGGLGDLLGTAAGFLQNSGLLQQFQQQGIPTQNFQSGSTMGTILSGLATNLIQSQLGGGQQQGGNSGGGLLGGLVNAAMNSGGAPSGGTQSSGGMGGLLSNVLGSQAGQQMIGGLISNVLGSNQQGSGLPNLSNILGGGGRPAQKSGMGGLMDMLLK
ncbi:MAG: TerB family tellurite resistance protein [Flammeovirgaceae bacterium]